MYVRILPLATDRKEKEKSEKGTKQKRWAPLPQKIKPNACR